MRQKKAIWHGLSKVFAFLLALSIIAGSILETNRTAVDNVFGSVSEALVSEEGESYDTFVPDAEYLNEDGTGNATALIKAAIDLGRRQEAEGAVLLKNNGTLPLEKGSEVTLLGARSHVMLINSGMGQKSQGCYISFEQALSASKTDFANTKLDSKDAITDYDFSELKYGGDGVEAGAGFQLNTTTIATYDALTTKFKAQMNAKATYEVAEPSVADLMAANANFTDSFAQYNDAAIIVVGRGNGESSDYLPGGLVEEEQTAEITEPLQLTENERAIIDLATEHFDKVIVLLNTNSAMEIGDLKDNEKIDAILWVGHPGNYGTLGIADVLCGNVSPSGGLYDIYATNNLSAPAMMNMGDYEWSNLDDITRKQSENYVLEAEGIYVGYRYYETRYFDAVYNQGNAKSTTGAYASDGAWDYTSEVAYGFGYGLSYTDFEFELSFDPEKDIEKNAHEIYATVTVKVTNKGDVAGKTPVQIYGQAPYTDYDKQNGVEKSAIQLLGFEKTDMIEPGKSETVEVKIDLQNLASYDSSWQNEDGTNGTYILDNGDYYFAVGNGAHDALNNVLAAQGKTVADGMDYDGKADLAQKWTYTYDGEGDVDYTTFAITKNNVQVSNQIEYIDWNTFGGQEIKYLSRSDWEGTYPQEYVSLEAPEDMIPLLNGKIAASSDGKTYYTIATDDDVSDITWNSAGTNYKFYELVLSDWDDYRWEDVLNQIDLGEATVFASNAGPTFNVLSGIEFNALTAATDNAGNGIVFSLNGTKDPEAPWSILEGADSNWNGQVFGSAPLVAASFNPDLMYEIGEFVGNEALFMGIPIVWGPGLNTHRHAYNGRNGEYYSEDPVLSGVCAMEFAVGARSKGLIAAAKHYAFNDQETNREGVAPFMTEQRAREIELRAYQYAIEAVKYDGEGLIGLMTSFSKVGPVEVTNSWGMNTAILQNEWGFHGYAVTDISDDKDLYTGMVYAGCTGYDLRSGYPTSTSDFSKAIGNQADGITLSADMFANDATMQNAVRNSVKRTLWTLTQSNLMNRYSAETHTEWRMTPWRAIYMGLMAVSGVLMIAMAALYVRNAKKDAREAGKIGKAFYLYIGAGVLAAIGMILYIVTNGIEGYAMNGGGIGIGAVILSVLLAIACAWATKKYNAQHYLTAGLGYGTIAAIMVAMSILISDRAVLASELFTWNSSNTVGWSAFNTGVASAVVLLVAVIIIIVNAFLDNKQEAKTM